MDIILVIIGYTIGFVFGFVAAVYVYRCMDKYAVQSGIIKLFGTIYKLEKIDI